MRKKCGISIQLNVYDRRWFPKHLHCTLGQNEPRGRPNFLCSFFARAVTRSETAGDCEHDELTGSIKVAHAPVSSVKASIFPISKCGTDISCQARLSSTPRLDILIYLARRGSAHHSACRSLCGVTFYTVPLAGTGERRDSSRPTCRSVRCWACVFGQHNCSLNHHKNIKFLLPFFPYEVQIYRTAKLRKRHQLPVVYPLINGNSIRTCHNFYWQTALFILLR